MEAIAECSAALRGIERLERPVAPPRPQTEQRPAGRLRPLILVVDDFEDAREMLADFLKGIGYRSAEASSGYEAIDKALGLRPAVILLDLAMPGMSGFEVARRLKSDIRTRSTPIIAITGHVVWTYENEAQEAGCDSFLTKPIQAQDLTAELRRMLQRGGGAPE